MINSNDIFTHPRTTPCDVIELVFRTFAAEWKTFMTIALARAGCLIGIFVVFMILVLLIGAGAAVKAAKNGSAFRLLESYYDGTDDLPEDDFPFADASLDASQFIATLFGVGIGFLILSIFFFLCLAYIMSAFEGAMVHAVAKTHTDHAVAVNIDSDRSSKIFLYSILFNVAKILANFTMITLPAFFITPSALILFNMLHITLYVLAKCALIGAIPAIVVEKTSTTEAFRRSWNLCASSICFILGNYICFILLEIVTAFLLVVIFIWGLSHGILPAIFTGLLFLVASLLMFPLSAIMEVTLYLNIRVQSESLNLIQLEEELSLSHTIANGVELPFVSKSDSEYKKCGQVEVTDAHVV